VVTKTPAMAGDFFSRLVKKIHAGCNGMDPAGIRRTRHKKIPPK